MLVFSWKHLHIYIHSENEIRVKTIANQCAGERSCLHIMIILSARTFYFCHLLPLDNCIKSVFSSIIHYLSKGIYLISHSLWLGIIFIKWFEYFLSPSLESDLHSRFTAKILPIRPRTLFNQSIKIIATKNIILR